MAAWEWLAKGAKRVQELGAEYTQHVAIVERLLTLDAAAAAQQFSLVWQTLDDRSRAALKMTVAGLTLKQQAASTTPEAVTRAERLKQLHALIDADHSTPSAPAQAAQAEAAITASAAQVTQKLAEFAERARPRAAEALESARKGIERHGPAIEAAVKAVVTEIVNANIGAQTARGSSSSATTDGAAAASTPPPWASAAPSSAAPDATHRQPPSSPGGETVPIAGLWEGELTGAAGTLSVSYRIMPSGRPAFGYQPTGAPFRIEELLQEGQRIQYVPPGGGVVTVVVQGVTGSPSASGYVIKHSFEGANNGYLTQRYQQISLSMRLNGSQLETTYVEAGETYFGDRTGSTGGARRAEYTGVLRRTGD